MILQRATLPLETLGCAAARVPIEHALRAVPGVTHVFVNPVTEMAYVEYNPERCDEHTLRVTLAELGYGTTPGHQSSVDGPRDQHERFRWLRAVAYRALRSRRSPATRALYDQEKKP